MFLIYGGFLAFKADNVKFSLLFFYSVPLL